jgi:DNA-binding transcriptional regulator of glucitol operon
LHLTVLVVVPGFLALGWWQLHRALGGNDLSWAYAFEWPFFAAYAVYLWWKLVHEPPEATSAEGSTAASVPSVLPPPEPTEEDEKLAAYNRYLADLHASDDRKPR